MSKGWISLNRGIRDHWIYQEDRVFSKYEAWIDLLLSANHCDNKTLIDGQLETVKRGTFITSIRKLQKKWKWSDTKVVKFFELLEAEKMASRKSDTKKTVVTIANYDVYQNSDVEKRHRNDSETTVERHRNDAETSQKRTNNNVNNSNNSNNANNSLGSSPPFTNNNINTYEEVEQNFGRPLSPIELETITAWLQEDNYDPKVIRLALREAVLNKAYSLKYIDRILLTWERKNIKTEHDVLEHLQKTRKSKVFVEKETPIEDIPKVPLYNWLDPDG